MLVSWGRSSHWVQLDSRRRQLKSVESLGTVGQSLRAAEVGRVVGYSWTVVAGSWGWSRLVDRYPRLWRYVVVNQGYIDPVAGRTWVRFCSGRTVRNSESLRGLRHTLQERWGQGKARALLGPLAVQTYRTGVKALSCQSRADVSDESEGFLISKPCGRTEALSGQSRADESEGFVGSKPCGRADGNEGFVGSKPCGREWRFCRVKAVRTRAKALLGQSRADERTRTKALSGQSRAGVRTSQKAEAKMGVILALRR